MARSKSDISNSAIRIFLQNVGKYYDSIRGFEVFVPKVKQKEELLNYFDNKCCYCGTGISKKTLSQDHLIPMNKEFLGLHAWGNVVPCCRDCNNEKNNKSWKEFIINKAGEKADKRTRKIEVFVESHHYNPNLKLDQIANKLYDDVGVSAIKLIDQSLEEAQDLIGELIKE